MNVANTFSVADVAVAAGGTPTFLWDFGDGNPVTNGSTSVSRAFTTTGTHTVKLVGLNPEFGPATRTQTVTVYAALSASVCTNGPTSIDQCQVTPTIYGTCTDDDHRDGGFDAIYTVTVTGGCSSYYTYKWESKLDTDTNWTLLDGSCSTHDYSFPATLGHTVIRCTITDNCGNTTTTESGLNIHRSTQNCSGGGGGGPGDPK